MRHGKVAHISSQPVKETSRLCSRRVPRPLNTIERISTAEDTWLSENKLTSRLSSCGTPKLPFANVVSDRRTG